MAKLSENSDRDGAVWYVAGFGIDTSSEKLQPELLQPEKLGPDVSREGAGAGLHSEALIAHYKSLNSAENASLKKENEELKNQYEDLRFNMKEEIDACQKASQRKLQACQRELQACQRELKACQRELQAFQKAQEGVDSNLKLRQLYNNFRYSKYGHEIDKELMNRARRAHRKAFLFYWDPLKKEFIETFLGIKMIKTFSVMVIELVNWKANLQNEKDGTSESPHRLLQIEVTINAIDSRLRYLQAVAKAFKDPQLRCNNATDAAIGEGLFSWSLLVAGVNDKCHPKMSSDVFKDMLTREYTYGGVDLRPAVQAAIRLLKLPSS